VHFLFGPRNFVNPVSGRKMDSLMAAVTGLLCHKASTTNGDQICRVQEALETARQPDIISCHSAPADSAPGDKTIPCAGRAMKTVYYSAPGDKTVPCAGRAMKTVCYCAAGDETVSCAGRAMKTVCYCAAGDKTYRVLAVL
jgi:hypothetical protein